MPNIYKRGSTFWGRVQLGGSDHRRSLRTRNRVEARRRLSVWVEELKEQQWSGQVRHRYREAATRFFDEYHVKRSTLERYRVSARMLDLYLRDLYLDQIDKKLIGRAVSDRRRKGASNATVRRDLTYLSRLCAFAVSKDWLEHNPVALVDKSVIRERRRPIRYPTDEDVAQVIAKANPMFARAIRFLEQTGMRQEEVASLTWPQLDLDRREATLTETKSGASRTVELSEQAVGTIAGTPRRLRQRGEVDWVFWRPDGWRYTQFASLFARVARRAGVRIRCHDLRHKYARDRLREGCDIYWLRGQMGHRSVRTTEIYLAGVTPPRHKSRHRYSGSTLEP